MMGKPLISTTAKAFVILLIAFVVSGCSSETVLVRIRPTSYSLAVGSVGSNGRLTVSCVDSVVNVNGQVVVAITNNGSDVVAISKRSMQVYVNDTLFMNDPLVEGGSVDAFYGTSSSSSIAFSTGGSYVPTSPNTALRSGAQYGEQAAGRSTSDAISSSASQMVGRLVRGSETITLHPKTTTTFTLYDPMIAVINAAKTSVPKGERGGALVSIKSDKQYDRDFITAKVKHAHADNVTKVLEQQRFRLIIGYTIVNQDPNMIFEDFLFKPRNPVFTTGW